ncbi:hypothetical protein [[Haemophilus] ducreyi]|nr:hypothetical protein [[Haemophilus] ducreyi]AKO45665.1 ABC transporter ATPase [[Haemophilus] ducreyi]AKO47051.1 ABC transporter ATPase [[Haemophilus] ducreyi]AKO48395.1 ABC transporter ATPase [[Haemophilus] ducreyi]AKO49782.1 ABC transporter ATPase [[Haemophilus] ducreyi]ANF67417.1 ABC transporter ATPase [[Haemophilus] ducreyi]
MRLLLIIFCCFLTACQMLKKTFVVPESIPFQGKSYFKVTDNMLEGMRHLLFLPAEGNQHPENWHNAIFIFLDQNKTSTIMQRMALRKKVFSNQQDTIAQIKIIENELYSAIIYPPTERFNDILLEVSRGRDSACGFAQIQVANKRAILTEKNANLTAYQAELNSLAQQLSTLAWQVACQ